MRFNRYRLAARQLHIRINEIELLKEHFWETPVPSLEKLKQLFSEVF